MKTLIFVISLLLVSTISFGQSNGRSLAENRTFNPELSLSVKPDTKGEPTLEQLQKQINDLQSELRRSMDQLQRQVNDLKVDVSTLRRDAVTVPKNNRYQSSGGRDYQQKPARKHYTRPLNY